jgi:hypothetical protein
MSGRHLLRKHAKIWAHKADFSDRTVDLVMAASKPVGDRRKMSRGPMGAKR